jgi:deazaflavin-dependent oxidoreductase (nitroreductase family)
MSTTAAGEHFTRKRPGWVTRNVFNRIVAGLTRLGLSLLGSRVLEVRGRSSGRPRRTPVNLLVFEGDRYLVAPRGDTQWVRNLRAAGEAEVSRRGKHERVRATEVADADKQPVIDAYLAKWGGQVKSQFKELPDPADHPVFKLEPLA